MHSLQRSHSYLFIILILLSACGSSPPEESTLTPSLQDESPFLVHEGGPSQNEKLLKNFSQGQEVSNCSSQDQANGNNNRPQACDERTTFESASTYLSRAILTSGPLLQNEHLSVNLELPPTFHPLFTEENYDSILKFVDLSYAEANNFGFTLGQDYPSSELIGSIRSRIVSISNDLAARGWGSIQHVLGRTGRDNVEPDLTCIVSSHRQQRIIVVAFHGSRSGNRNPLLHNGSGDWGSNYDSGAVAPNSIGISDFPNYIRIHRGFGNNLASARINLLSEVQSQISSLGSGPIWIWVTGHSKGGAMAGLGAALIKAYLGNLGSLYTHVKVGALQYSAPRAFQSIPSQEWVHQLLDRRNIFRINVSGDPVPSSPSRTFGNYRSLGVLFFDFIQDVNQRAANAFGLVISHFESYANYHYGSSLRGAGLEFTPQIVLPYFNLRMGFQQGRIHLQRRQR